MSTFVLVHSPIVGPMTWSLVADELARRGDRAAVPSLLGRAWLGTPIWRQHVDAVVDAIGGRRGAILVGHSGAGPLLPLVAETADVAGVVFVDASIRQREPLGGLLAKRPAPDGRGFVPAWADDETLRALIPDDELRRRCLDEIRGMPERYFTEIIPAPRTHDVPSGFVLFSETFRRAADELRDRGAPVIEIPGGHFQMLVEPRRVADAIEAVARELPRPRPVAVAR